MDKTKIGAILALVVVGGFLLVSKMQEAPAPEADPDHHEEAAAQTPPESSFPTPKNGDYRGDITALTTKDDRVGTGPAAAAGDQLSMNYKGTLINGEVFDQSYGREPFDFRLGTGQVIKGWDQGIVGMKAGGKRTLKIPADLGYGERGSPPKIPANASLIFEVELLKIGKK